MGRFKNKIVLVTGASTGIGLETVARIQEEGGTVYGGYNKSRSEDTAALSIKLDVTSEVDWKAALDKNLSREGRIDVLINNAGARKSGLAENTSMDLWRQLIDINLTGTFLGCRAVIPAMRSGGGGAIVNVGSITGIRGTENMLAYSASKSGVVSMTSSLALDHAKDNIRVNSVAPAAIATRMVKDWLRTAVNEQEAEAAVVSKHPIGRIGRPDEVASVIAFLASDDASFITGVTIPVDGGRSIR